MRTEPLLLVPEGLNYGLPSDVVDALKEGIIQIGKDASRMTLQMTYLDPNHTRSQSIGTYLRDNFTSRLEEAFGHNRYPDLRVVSQRQQFKLCLDSKDGRFFSFPVHRSGADYVPKGGVRLKKDVRLQQSQLGVHKSSFSGLFVGLTYHEENGLIEIFLGNLVPLIYKTKYRTHVLATLYRKKTDVVDKKRILEHSIETPAAPVVLLKS